MTVAVTGRSREGAAPAAASAFVLACGLAVARTHAVASGGLSQDTRVRWGAGRSGPAMPDPPRLVSAMEEPAHLALRPFGRIPTGEEGDLAGAPARWNRLRHIGSSRGFWTGRAPEVLLGRRWVRPTTCLETSPG